MDQFYELNVVILFSAKYDYSWISPVEEMRKEQPLYDTSSDDSGDESEADEQKKKKWVFIKHDEDAMYLKMEMPGVGKEDVKIYIEGSIRTYELCVKGIRKLDSKFDDEKTCHKSYECRVSLMPILKYRADMIKAEMVNGVLKGRNVDKLTGRCDC